jgi:hypothetical protein
MVATLRPQVFDVVVKDPVKSKLKGGKGQIEVTCSDKFEMQTCNEVGCSGALSFVHK